MVHIKTLTASSSANLSFVHGSSSVVLDSTYPIYVFKLINIHPATNNVQLMHNGSIDAGSNYNVAATTTTFEGESYESDQNNTLNYITGHDHAQDSGGKKLTYNMGNDNYQGLSGEMILFNPSSSTFVKHFLISSEKFCKFQRFFYFFFCFIRNLYQWQSYICRC